MIIGCACLTGGGSAGTVHGWLAIAGKLLAGWLVIDLDATLITARSDKEGAAPTFKSGYGFHPLGAWLANTAESLAMLLRPGNAGSNTFAGHLTVLTAALRQIPARMRARLLVRVDGAGASHDLIDHLLSLGTRCRTVLFTSGWAITQSVEMFSPFGNGHHLRATPGTCEEPGDRFVARVPGPGGRRAAPAGPGLATVLAAER